MPAYLVRTLSLALSGALALVIALATPALAPPGDLDPTFDMDGRATTDFSGDGDDALALAIQSDGKVIAGGYDCHLSGCADFTMARYNLDGSLDGALGGDGKVTINFAGGQSVLYGLAIQSDGKIVAAGDVRAETGELDFALARFTADGSLDASFEGDGKVTTDFDGGFESAFDVAIQADGKIVAAGGNGGDSVLARYNTNGSLDVGFGGGDGKVIANIGGSDQANDVAIQGDGKIVTAGRADFGDFALARYTTDGSLDPAFDTDGKVTTDFASGSDNAEAVAIQGDGKIVAAGDTVNTETFDQDYAVARYNVDGSLDLAFGAGSGKVTTDFSTEDRARSLVIQADGRIVVAGCASCSSTASDFALARLNPSGSLDPSFGGGDGKVATDFGGGRDFANGVVIQPDGKIVAAGCADCFFGTGDFALARYTVCRVTSRRSSIPCG